MNREQVKKWLLNNTESIEQTDIEKQTMLGGDVIDLMVDLVKNSDLLHSVSGSLPCGKATCKYELNETEKACDFCNDRIKTNSH